MSDSSFTETDPIMQIYEARAIIIEKDQEIERLRQEIERLRIENSNKNQLELAQKVTKLKEDLASKIDNLSDRLEFALNQKVAKLERDLASTNDKLSGRVEKLVVNQIQNAVRTENKVEKQSGGQQNTSVLILGGWGSLDKIYLLDSNALSWKKLRISLQVEMHDFGAVVFNEKLYIFGGLFKDAYQLKESGDFTYHHHCYKLKDDGSWMKLASLNQKRAGISNSSLVYKGDIWVIGGDSGESLNSVEKYDISHDKWTYMPEMNYARRHAAAAVFEDRIFVSGGLNGERSVEMFDPKLQKWVFFCALPTVLSGHTMLINNSTLSIFGGFSGSGLNGINSVWEMDIEDPEKKWTENQSFKHPRWLFGIGKLSKGIIVFGSWAIHDETSEIFNGNEWIDGPKLPQHLAYFAYTSIPRSLEESFLKKFS